MENITSQCFTSKVLLLSAFLYLFISAANAQLASGDLAIIGYNGDTSPDEMAIVALADIPSGQTIYIADYGWDGSAFNGDGLGEGAITWVTTSMVPAGTILNITNNAGAIGGDLSTYGTVSSSGWTFAGFSPLLSDGDNWFIYQGSTAGAVPTTWVFGWNNSADAAMSGGWLTSGTINFIQSYLPSALTEGTTAISLNAANHYDNTIYTGPTSGDKATLLAAITNTANWTGSETVTQDLSAGGTSFPTAFTIGAIAPPNTAPTASSFTASGGPVENQTFTFATSDFSYNDTDGDPLDHVLIETIPGAGTLYVDANNNDSYDGGEELSANDQVSKADLDAGNLQYIQNGTTNTSFQFEVNDGTENSSGNYVATLNITAAVSVSVAVDNNTTCNGGSDGSVTATANTGTANYSYSWSNGATTNNTASTTNTINGLAAGTYTVTITDNNGTTATASETVTEPATVDPGSVTAN